ncbi:MAG: hypothetical protein OXG47_03755 [bacterium]|nr:hypothetical protein [bacterium]
MAHTQPLTNPPNDADYDMLGQVPTNAKIFRERYDPNLLADHVGQIALIADGEYINVFANYDAAFAYTDEHRYQLGEFSLHHVGPAPARYSGAYTVTLPSASTQ